MPKRTRISALDSALCVLRGYAIAKGARIPARTSIREQISPEFLLALLTGYALGKGLSVFALDEEQWKTSVYGKHYEIDTETGEIIKGNIGQKTGPAAARKAVVCGVNVFTGHTLKVDKKEMRALLSAINSEPNKFKDRTGRTCCAFTANYFYQFTYGGKAGKHKIHGRLKLTSGNQKRIRAIMGEAKHGSR